MTIEDQLLEDGEAQQGLEEIQVGVETRPGKGDVTITLRRWHIYAFVVPGVFLVGLALGFLVRGWVSFPASATSAAAASVEGSDRSVPAGESDPAEAASNQQIVRYDVPVDDDPVRGPDDAPITIVEFSDFECPYCRRWHAEVYQQLFDTYGDQIRLVYRDFPLESIHPNAEPAAQAANCAYEQGAFWGYHDRLFSMELGLGQEAYLEYASQLDLDEVEFQDCLESKRYQEEVQSDFEFAANLGVRSTPTFFINGIAVVGAQPFDIFQQVIERELAGEIP